MQQGATTPGIPTTSPIPPPPPSSSTAAAAASVHYQVAGNRPHRGSDNAGVVPPTLTFNFWTRNVAQSSNSGGQSRDQIRASRIRRRRNKIGLIIVFAAMLLFAGLVICANTKEYIAGVTISVIGVILGSFSTVMCLVLTDACKRVHDRTTTQSSAAGASRAMSRDTAGIASSTDTTSQIRCSTPVPGTSREVLTHHLPPSYETSEGLILEASETDPLQNPGVGERHPGGGNNFQYYRITDSPFSAISTASGVTVNPPSDSHGLCHECIHRRDAESSSREGHLLLAPSIVVQLPSYDEAIADDSDRNPPH